MNALRKISMAVLSIALTAIGAMPTQAAITDLGQWTLVQDPPHANLSASATATQATLLAGNSAIPSATDIGYQSVTGLTPAASTAGYAFDPSADFALAIDFAMSFSNTPTGMLAIGFGIGEDGDGANSAGAALLTSNGSPFPIVPFAGAARVHDVSQTPQALALAGTLSGSLFASYDASTGSITLGAAPAPGAASPAAVTTYAGIQDQWDGGLLLASFFLRSEGSFGQPWQSGNGQVAFSNFRVLSGAPAAVPEPSSLALLAAAGMGLMRRRRA